MKFKDAIKYINIKYIKFKDMISPYDKSDSTYEKSKRDYLTY